MPTFLMDNGEQLVLDMIERIAVNHANNGAAGGRLLARVPLEYANFQLPRDETFWWGVRTGHLDPDLSKYQLRVIPGDKGGTGRLQGYTVELSCDDQSYCRDFSIRSLSDVAQRKLVELVKEKATELEETCHYYLTTIPAESRDAHPGDTLRVKACHEPLVFEEARLSDYMGASEQMFGVSEPPSESTAPPMPVFVTQDVWDESRAQAFRGGENESAAMYSGRLFRDADSHEVFVRFDACLEAAHAVEEKLSVTFTGETWASTRQLLQTRRTRLDRPHEIFVASIHRHPWLPPADAHGRRTCDVCSAIRFCSRSTAVPSTDDFQWHRSVFAGQPWGTLLIWGYNAREEADFRLYGLEDAAFKERTIRLLKEEP